MDAPVRGSDLARGPAQRGKSSATWNGYVSVLRQWQSLWETYAARQGTPFKFLPADPTHFANFLA